MFGSSSGRKTFGTSSPGSSELHNTGSLTPAAAAFDAPDSSEMGEAPDLVKRTPSRKISPTLPDASSATARKVHWVSHEQVKLIFAASFTP